MVIMLQSITANPYLILILILMIVFLLGFVLEGTATMIMLVPIFVPIVAQYGLDPHHFGLLYVIMAQTANLTPPVALGLAIACGFAGTTMEETFPEIIPFLIVIFVVVALIIFVPGPFLWLPRLFGFI